MKVVEFLTFEEAHRAFLLAVSLCHRASDGGAVLIDSSDIEIVALGLFLAVENCEHAQEVAEVVTREGESR